MLESNMAAILESQMDAILGFISTYILASGAIRNLIVATKHISGHGKHFPTII